MSAYTITSSRKPRGLTVTDTAGQVLATIQQPRYFSHDMEGNAGEQALRIAKEGFWRMSYSVFLEGTQIGRIKTTAWSQLQWLLTFRGKPPVDLQFVSAAWKHRYYLRLAKDLPLLEVAPRFRWSSFTTAYAVNVVGSGIAPEQMPVMLALAGFSAQLKRARAQASGSA